MNSTMPPLGQPDRDVLRDLADNGNEQALDRLADLADDRDDLEELQELLDEGCARAGGHLTRRAVAARDLRKLQELSDAGADDADQALKVFLSQPE
jgi:hypothetical protein